MTHNKKLMSISQIAEALGPSPSYIGAVTDAMYWNQPQPKPRWFDLEEVRAWIMSHPGFRVAHVRGAKAKRVFGERPANPPAETAGKSGESHGSHD